MRLLDGRGAHWIAVALLLAQSLLLLDTAQQESETYDEPMYLLTAGAYWEDGDFSLNREHPPLTKLLIGVPLALADYALPGKHHVDPTAPVRFMYEMNQEPERMLMLGRLAPILLGLVLGFYVYLFGRIYGGGRVGLLALLVYLFMPVVTGNTPLATLDLGSATFCFVALYHLTRLRQKPGAGRTLVAGITLGLAQLTRFSALLLLPIYALLLVLDAVRQRSLRPLGRLLCLCLVAFSTLFFGYGCEMRTLESVEGHPRFQGPERGVVFHDSTLNTVAGWFGDGPVPLLSYLKGFDDLRYKAAEEGQVNYLLGETRRGEGFPHFYLVSLMVKTPAGILLAVILAVLLLPWLKREKGAEGPLFLFPVLLLLYLSLAPKQSGIRYILPIMPMISVLVARLLTLDVVRHRVPLGIASLLAFIAAPLTLYFYLPRDAGDSAWLFLQLTLSICLGLVLFVFAMASTWEQQRRIVLRGGLVFLVLMGGVEASSAHPEYLMYYNQFAGGADHGWRITSVGDDWGQGASTLARMQKERGWSTIHYSYYGTGRPEAHGLDFLYWSSRRPEGLLAIHVSALTRYPERYGWLLDQEPIARADSILVFRHDADRRQKRR